MDLMDGKHEQVHILRPLLHPGQDLRVGGKGRVQCHSAGRAGPVGRGFLHHRLWRPLHTVGLRGELRNPPDLEAPANARNRDQTSLEPHRNMHAVHAVATFNARGHQGRPRGTRQALFGHDDCHQRLEAKRCRIPVSSPLSVEMVRLRSQGVKSSHYSSDKARPAPTPDSPHPPLRCIRAEAFPMRIGLSGNRRNIGGEGRIGGRGGHGGAGCLPGDGYVGGQRAHLDHGQFHGFGAAWGVQRVSDEMTSGHVGDWTAVCEGNHRQQRRRRRNEGVPTEESLCKAVPPIVGSRRNVPHENLKKMAILTGRIPLLLSRAACRSAALPQILRRNISSSVGMVDIETPESHGGKIAILRMSRAPVNSLNYPFMKDLTSAIEILEKDKNVRGFILASGCSKVYCAGLDLMTVHNPKPEEISSFWTQLQTLWLKLYSTPLASVAAVSGSAPAAGCMLALSCDYRVMASGYQIGYNETKFGLVAPPFFIATLKNTVGQRQAELLTLKGTMMGTTDAVKIGMVDEEVQEADVMTAAEKNIISLISVNDKARRATKAFLRGDTCAAMSEGFAADKAYSLAWISSPKIQEGIGAYIAALKAKKK